MKVLILSHSSELSGAELSMLDLFDYWVGMGEVEPHFIIRRPLRNMSKALRDRNWPYTALYYTNWSNRNPDQFRRAADIYRNALFNTKAVFEIEELITQLKPDIIMTNTIVSPWAAIAAHYQQVPHVWFVREYGDIDHRHIFEVGKENMLKDIGELSSLVVTNSKTLAKHIGQYIAPDKITPLYTPFNLENLKQKSQQKAKNPFKHKDSLRLVITGRVAPSKGQDSAAEAVGQLVKKGHNIELCIIGKPSEPDDANSLNNAINKYEISDRVHLIGHKANPLATVKYADVGLMASRGEAFGRVTFEYMSVGLPVIGANSGATPELVEDGHNGFLYQEGNREELAEKIAEYSNDRQLVEVHGSAASKRAERMMSGGFNADTLFDKVSAIVNDEEKNLRQPLYYSHRWLEYPRVAEKYIKDSGVISLKRLIYHRLRHRAKWVYLAVARVFNFVHRGFKRSA